VDIVEYVTQEFGTLDELFRMRVTEHPDRVAAICADRQVTFEELDALADRIASSLQRDGVQPGHMVSICASSSIDYVAIFIAILRVGATVAPLPPSATPAQLITMLEDCRATHLFSDTAVSRHLTRVSSDITARRVALESDAEGEPFEVWMAPEGATPTPVPIDPSGSFNIIYSSGTTGTPKGIIHSHRMRWPQITSLQIRHRGTFSYIDATLTDATTLKLCRLRYVGSAHQWQFAIYRASHDDYDESVFPTGLPIGTCQDALDTACGLYLNDPTAWT